MPGAQINASSKSDKMVDLRRAQELARSLPDGDPVKVILQALPRRVSRAAIVGLLPALLQKWVGK